MNTTLAVVVSAIVILITALVVITIFGGGIGQVGGATSPEAICRTNAVSTCRSTGQMPITWGIPTVRDAMGNLQSCQQATQGANSCSSFGVATGGGVPGGGGVTASTCGDTFGQTCRASCPTGYVPGVGTCPQGQACCRSPTA